MAAPEVPVAAEEFALLHGSASGASVFSCALCGARFTHAEKACARCPLNRGCEVVRCPQCGYQFPRESQLLRLARKLWGRRGA